MREGRQRLDKWLWHARFARTRSLAARLVTDGFVRVNGQRVEAVSRAIGPGDVLTVAAPHVTAVIRVLGTAERRGPAPEARLLYEEVGPRDDAALVSREGSP